MHRLLLAVAPLLVAAALVPHVDLGWPPHAAAQSPLTLKLLTPTYSPAAGGTVLTIVGTGFDTTAGGTRFINATGQSLFKDVMCSSTTQCSATAPPMQVPFMGAFFSQVHATANGFQSSNFKEFIWYGRPGIANLSPASGPASGGTVVTLSGGVFPSVAPYGGPVAIRFGDKQAIFAACPTPGVCWARAPAGTGTVHVTITTPGGTSNSLPFTYTSRAPAPATLAPALPRCTPWSGPLGLIIPWQNCTG